ncbi:uric acid-xanthine permease isoform X2 [Cryptomeria japonica]|uniref:uric acid-xanthine permease isoform X2 n=1 Tax=Cryptomeria japonica TaxID=3369 RepID=UPI0027D9FE9D|nr:uric acid-xanthine permease isoform X2 [Cryptomeria japonica]
MALMESNSNEEISNSREEEQKDSGQRSVELIGNYNWGFLCTPRIVCGGKRDLLPFYGKDEKIPLLLAAVMGLQHALAMVGGIITPPILISSSAGFSTSTQAYLVSAALIVSSLASLVQILQFKIPFTSYVLGSGLLSVMGITFAVVPIVNQVVSVLTACTCNGISCSVNGSCKACNQQLEGECLSGEDAYGHILGTILVCCWLQVAASFCPARILRRIFPPTVTGTCIILIGVSLITTGFENWGGGSYCATQVLTSEALCTGNGDVKLPFGHRYYVGLGFVVFCALVLVEMFGSPFMRNSQVIIGLAIGMLVASLVHVTHCEDNCQLQSCRDICYGVLPEGVHYNSSSHTISGIPKSFYQNATVCVQQCNPATCNKTCQKYRYVTGTKIVNADWVTFLWVHTFPLKFYAPAVLPLFFALMTATMDCIGDVTATVEASFLEPFGFRDAIILVLSNGFSVGGLLALVLNLILPFDDDEKELPLKKQLLVRSTSIDNRN